MTFLEFVCGRLFDRFGLSVLIIGTGLGVRLLYWLAMKRVTRRTQAWTQPGERPAAGGPT